MSLFPPVPSIVEECSCDALEWGRLRELVAGYAQSQAARGWLEHLMPSRDPEWISREHGLVEEMRVLLASTAAPPLRGLFDPTEMVAKARIAGASLDAEQLRDLLLLLDSITAWQKFLEQPPESVSIPGLVALSELAAVGLLARLSQSLRSRMNPDGTLDDDASPDLRRIRREIERQQRAIEESLRKSLRRLSEGGETQEDLITIRGERFVIPVKAEFKRRIPGVVHGASSSGQTVYLEPLETIEQNNELVRLLDDEQAEIRKIYLGMTREVGAEADAIVRSAAGVAQADALQARARFAGEFDCVRPQFSGSSSAAAVLTLTDARHPLLERRLREGRGTESRTGAAPASGARIVPITLTLEDARRQLIISGPNTGGKTVALKTTGLLSMMAQAGIPAPASVAVFPLFDAFLADIGDAQSIERDLSTFSAHIDNLNRILRRADAESLVLLDELGSSTDPEEGAALAVAIAESFLERRAWCLISTHHTALKVYAARRPEVLNAAVGFDERTLGPTYELRLGTPGASAGINIAQRLGLDPSILEKARGHLSSQARDISHFLDRLHAQLDAAGAERETLRRQQQEVAREKSRLESEGLKEWRAKVRDLEQKLEALLKDFSYRMRETVAAIGDRAAQQKISKEADRRIARLRREFSEQFNAAVVAQHSGADQGDTHAEPHVVRNVAAGDMVRLKSLGKSGRVVRQIEANLFEVAIGPMKMRVARSDIAEVEDPARAGGQPLAVNPVAAARQRGISVSLASTGEARSEINVIGRTVQEATEEVDQFLDRAFLAGLPRVRIVHGMGMGVLRKALREQLKRHPHVAGIAEAGQAEGGAGATVVELLH